VYRALGESPQRWPRPVELVEPPVPPPGQRTAPPDFVGVGVQKAGTSWWFDLIADHPQVTAPPFKELHYFDQFFGRPFSPSDVERYARFFPRVDGTITGEWTPRYVHDVWSVPLLRRAAPDAKLLVLLRDPVERYRSGLGHDLARHAPENPLVASVHVARSDYVDQLRHLFAHVDQTQVLVLQYERCQADTTRQLARTYEFLGLDAGHVPPDLGRQVNVSLQPKPDLPGHVRDALAERWREQVPELTELVPDLDPGLWRSLR
jgi:hypothetical protein